MLWSNTILLKISSHATFVTAYVGQIS